MRDWNLVLKFQLSGENQQVRGASRIKVDGRGGLMFYDVHSETAERIDLGRLQSLSLFSMATQISDSALPN